MAIPHAYPGMPVDLRPDGESFSEAQSAALVKNEIFESIRMVIPKGHEMSRHQVEGAITIYCLDGRIAFTTGGKTHDLKAGHWLFLLGNEPHSLGRGRGRLGAFDHHISPEGTVSSTQNETRRSWPTRRFRTASKACLTCAWACEGNEATPAR